MRILSPKIHGVLDYVAATVLVAGPFLLGIHKADTMATMLSVLLGAGLFGYSMITDYAYSLAGAVSFRIHLVFDTVAGLGAIAAPYIFGFADIAKWYYIAMGVGVLIVVMLTDVKVNDEAF